MKFQPWHRRAAQAIGVLIIVCGGLVVLFALEILLFTKHQTAKSDLLIVGAAVAGFAVALGGRRLLAWGSGA